MGIYISVSRLLILAVQAAVALACVANPAMAPVFVPVVTGLGAKAKTFVNLARLALTAFSAIKV